MILLAELLAIILALANMVNADDFVYDLALHSLFIQLVALSCAAGLCIFRGLLSQLPESLIAPLSYLLILLISFFVTELVWFFMHNEPYMESANQSHISYSLRCMLITAITAALVLRYLYVQHQWRKQIEAESRARVAALQARIRPHFLFNCMNTIASLTRKQPKLAEESIENLAALFRASLQKTEQSSTLKKEFELCRQYLSIEQHRLGDRLQCEWDIDDIALDTRIPPLTLQPLIENAIYHGIEPLANGGTVEISGQQNDKEIVIRIRNPINANGTGQHHDGNHIAQENVRQRLMAFYDSADCFNVVQSENDYRVEINIPLA